MFSWLKKLFAKQEPTPVKQEIEEDDELEDDCLYLPKDRLIFKYFDGSKIVRADPMVLYRKLSDVSVDLSVDLTVALSPSKDAGSAYQKMIEKIMKVFSLVPLEGNITGGGLTENESFLVYVSFCNFVDYVKKNSSNPVMLQKVISEDTQNSKKENPPT